MSDVGSGWFPVVTLLVGYGTKALSDWIEYRRAGEREKVTRDAVRKDKLFERRTTSQRETLLELQEAVALLARASGAAHHADSMAYGQTKEWAKQLLPEPLSDGFRVAQVLVGKLAVRVTDQSVRELVEKFRDSAVSILHSQERKASEEAMMVLVHCADDLNRRIGELLRKLDDDESSSH